MASELLGFFACHATKQDLRKAVDQIMSAISEFAVRQGAFNARIDAAVVGIGADVDALKALIVELQNTIGTVTPEDQALLDEIERRTGAVADRLDALDALTPPAVPVP